MLRIQDPVSGVRYHRRTVFLTGNSNLGGQARNIQVCTTVSLRRQIEEHVDAYLRSFIVVGCPCH
jgi:hypothetical protein